MITFICYPKCTTCQRAQKWLDEHGVAYELRDIKEQKPTKDELREWYSRAGLPLKRFFNTSGLLYKSMGLKDKLEGMTYDALFELLSTDGMLVKRPIVVTDEAVLVGFREEEWAKQL